MDTSENSLWFPRSAGKQRPSAWWYYGRAIFVSRHDYKKIFLRFIAVGLPLGLTGLVFNSRLFWGLAWFTGFLGLALLILSLLGLYLQYGHPAKNYFKKLLALESIPQNVTLADIHIGTYRHSYMLNELLPVSKIYSVDCKREPKFSEELAVREVQALETPPENKNITTIYTGNFYIPLIENSCDAVVFGFGTHEIPTPERTRIFEEAKRILKPGGKLFLFEHGIDLLNYFIFGPVIYHVTKRKHWKQLLKDQFSEVKQSRLYAVNIFSAVNKK
jgi:ubiquinone/menaquinone biosynthesis C-methylase UbiE